MKNFLILIIFFSFVQAQVIVSTDGRRAKLPSRFVVTPEGIEGFVPGQSEPRTIKWEAINLSILSRSEPEIEKARQEAILKNERIFFLIKPPPNYYKEFFFEVL